MATSDAFIKKKKVDPALYRTIGPGFSFSFRASCLYEPEDAERAAILRAKNLGGRLDRFDSSEKKFVTIYGRDGVVLPEIDMNARAIGVSNVGIRFNP